MAVTSTQMSAGAKWVYAKANTGLRETKQDGSITSLLNTPNEEVFAAQYTLAAAATQNVDLRNFTNLVGTAVVGTKLYGITIKAEGVAGAKAKLSEAASNGLTLSPLVAGTTPSLTVSAPGHISLGSTLDPITIDATHKNLTLTNTGTEDVVITFIAQVGTS